MTRARKTVGRITFVGTGPGDPGLLTTRAADAIRSAEVVVADAAVPGGGDAARLRRGASGRTRRRRHRQGAARRRAGRTHVVRLVAR